jgi:hypothetical protein
MTSIHRTALLATMGAADGAQWFTWPTATAVLDTARGVILVATDPEPAPDDWDAVCLLLELAGYDNGTGGPFSTDPGEPECSQALSTWRLELSKA